jgi:hypothetical protein
MSLVKQQTAIPFVFMRGGTSRGPYFRQNDLPKDRAILSKVLIAALGSGDPNNIDGLGGGTAVTTKVAILSLSDDPAADIDYLFAQVSVDDCIVDYAPTCGNILVGVGPAAIELGLISPKENTTSIRIRAVNTGALVEAVVQTPGGEVSYDGDMKLDGVNRAAAPVELNFFEIVGSKTGELLPTGQAINVIEGIEVSCVDVAVPMMIARASDFGIIGTESRLELDQMPELFSKIESFRLKAGKLMGLGDVTKSVVPKVGLISKPQSGGHFEARYFMPWSTHPSMAVTGSLCLASSALVSGTIFNGITKAVENSPETVRIEHPIGYIDVLISFTRDINRLNLNKAGVARTARLIAQGEVLVPRDVWNGKC